MYKRIFNHLNQFSIKRGLIIGYAAYGKDMYDRHSLKRSFIKPEDLSEELMAKNKVCEQILERISKHVNANAAFNAHMDKLEEAYLEDPKIVWTNDETTVACYDFNNNLIILGASQTDRINGFIIAHEYAHYKFDRPKKYEMFIPWVTATLIGVSSITAGLMWSISFGLLLSPTLLQYRGLANEHIAEDRADKFALRLGYAKEGYEFFQKMDDNYADYEHPLISLRRAQAFEAMVKDKE